MVPESLEMIALSARRLPSSQATTCGFIGLSCRVLRSRISSSHFFISLRALLEKIAILVLFELRQQRGKRFGAVRHDADLDRIAQTDPGRIDIDLHAARFSRFGIELDIRKGGAGDQQRVALFERFLRCLGAQQADPARCIRTIVRNDRLAEQRLDDRAPKAFGDRDHLVSRIQRALPGENGDFLPFIQNLGRASQESSSPGSRALRARTSAV